MVPAQKQSHNHGATAVGASGTAKGEEEEEGEEINFETGVGVANIGRLQTTRKRWAGCVKRNLMQEVEERVGMAGTQQWRESFRSSAHLR